MGDRSTPVHSPNDERGNHWRHDVRLGLARSGLEVIERPANRRQVASGLPRGGPLDVVPGGLDTGLSEVAQERVVLLSGSVSPGPRKHTKRIGNVEVTTLESALTTALGATSAFLLGGRRG